MYSFLKSLLILMTFRKIHIYGADIAKSVYRQATGWTAGVRLPAGARYLSLLHNFQTGSGAQSAS
jgi:hypothetical protein